jgi:osmotically inducible protein OsmC
MSTTRTAHAHWDGTLLEGKGTVSLDSSGLASFDVTWVARAEAPGGLTSPEELIAAAHSACYSMALSNGLAKAGTPSDHVDVKADVSFKPGTGITGIHLTVRGKVPGMTEEQFQAAAADAAANCPVSKALAATPITHEATLES